MAVLSRRSGRDDDQRGLTLDVQENDAGDLDADIKRKLAPDAQLPLSKRHLHVRRLLLHDADAIVDVQLALRGGILTTGRDDKLKVGRAQLGRRHRARRAQREHRAAADVQRDRGEVHVGECDVPSGALDGRERREVVESVFGQVDRHARRVLLRHGRDEDRVAKEEL